MMALDEAQQTRLDLINDLITSDPAAAHTLAERFGELVRRETAARGLQLSQAERAAAEQLSRNTGQPVQVVDVKAEPEMTAAEEKAYLDYRADQVRWAEAEAQIETGMAEREGGQ